MAVSKKFEATPSDLKYADFALKQETVKEDAPWYKSYPASAAKGLVEGAIRFGEALGPLPEQYSGQREKAKEQREKLYKEYLPSSESPIAGGIERGGKLFPLLATGGAGFVGSLLRSGLGAIGGEIAKHLGSGELGQAIGEAPGLIGPDLAKLIPTAGKQTQLVDFARGMGLTEEELALALGQQGSVRRFAEEVSSKGGKTVEAFDKTRKSLGRVWDTLRGSPEAQQPLNGVQASRLIKNLSNRLSKLPTEQRNKVQGDYNDLLSSQMTGDDVMNFWQDLNYYIQRGDRGLGVLKQDLQAAMMDLNPKLGEDFKLTNELYGNFSNLAERMGPDIAEQLIQKGETGIVLSAITTGNYPLLQKIIGPVAGRQVARIMITNPRFQNLSQRFMNGVERGIPSIAKAAYDQLVLELGKINAEAAMAISNFDVEEFVNALPKQDKQEQQQQE